ncbi:MAG: 30S ribosomal protein S7, partial [Archaeoglobaceae archaeon]|nr:30S ribosomal protein S7 [Archaeoglobaceae archaeon]MDW8117694.1 30S ribosomal protein S7 [Archaeoglobaceae archaeon]
ALKSHICLNPSFTLHSHGKHSDPFGKEKVFVVERLINKVMRKERNTGKKNSAYNIVREAFEIIERKTKKNPIQVLVDAIVNAGPREEVVRIKYGGIAVPKAVDTSSLRRVDVALRNIVEGARRSAFKSKKSIAYCLADEIIAASNNDTKSFAVSKKEEVERVAKSAR